MNKLDLLMQPDLIAASRTKRWFYLFILIHLCGWTLLPTLVRYNLPLDAIEGTIWGHQLEWGYDKNPFLNGWLTALANYLSHRSDWMIYFFSQLSVITAFLAIWHLAKQMLSPLYALIAVMLLEGVQYYHFHAIDFNDNTLELGLWALTIYFFYRALQQPLKQTLNIHWLFTGLFAGLGMMAKYYTAALLTAMLLFLLLRPENRKQLGRVSPYLGGLIFIAIISPHVIWLFSHDFITVTYVFARATSLPRFSNHFIFPLQFAWQQIEVFSSALFLFAFLFLGKKPILATKKILLRPFDKAFLYYVGLGPFLLTLLLSFLFGSKLRAGWGMPLLTTWSIILIAFIQPELSKAKLYRFITATFLSMGILFGAYQFSLTNSPDPSSANFPGNQIAKTITKIWQDTYHTPLTYVAGSRWIGGNISFYSKDHPAVFIEWNQKRAPWINLDDFKQKGAVFVWNISDKETLPAAIEQHYPQLKNARIFNFTWHRNTHQLPPIQIGVALLSPQG